MIKGIFTLMTMIIVGRVKSISITKKGFKITFK